MNNILIWVTLAFLLFMAGVLTAGLLMLRKQVTAFAKQMANAIAVTTLNNAFTDIAALGPTANRWSTVDQCLKIIRQYDTPESVLRLEGAVAALRKRYAT